MFKPQYKITNKLLQNIKKITEISTNLNSQNFSKPVIMEYERRAKELSAYSSTSIEGNPLPLTEVKKILKHKPENIRDSEREVLNYNKALTDLNVKLKKENLNFNLKLILDIQKEVINGLLPKIKVGRLRQEPVFVNDPRKGKTIYYPPDHQDAGKLMNNLIDFVKENRNKIDPLILSGIFHKQFVIIHPFIDGNGRTVRLTTKVLLAKMGLDTFNLFSFENYYNKNITKYFETVGEKGNYYDLINKIEFTKWLEYFTDGIIDELLRVSKELEKDSVNPNEELKSYHKKILNFIEKNGYIKDSDYSKITPRKKATRNLDFRKLISMGLIERHSEARASYYKLKR